MGKVLFYDVSEQEWPRLEHAFHDESHWSICVKEELTHTTLDTEAEVLSLFVTSKVTRDKLERMPNLRLIACRSTGYNNIDMQAARERNITVVNVPTYGSHTVAEYAFGLILSLTRRLPQAIVAAHVGNADRKELQGIDLNGRTLGIIGTGSIGSNVARIAKGFGMQIIAYDKLPKQELANQIGFAYATFDDVLHSSDILSLHTPYTPENHHFIDTPQFAKMKQGSYLINTARGELVNNQALIESLKNQHLAGAGLDVIEGEELLDTTEELMLLRSEHADPQLLRHSLEISALQKLPSVITTRHNAFNTAEAIARIDDTTINNISGFLNNQPINVVS